MLHCALRKGLDAALLEELLRPQGPAEAPGSGQGGATGAAGSAGPGGGAGAGAAAQPGPSRLVNLSCGYQALERDAAALVVGGWRVASAEAFTFFPGTDSLETLAVFERG